MHKRDREHGSGPKCDEEIEDRRVYLSEKIEEYARCRDEKEYDKREEEVHGFGLKRIYERNIGIIERKASIFSMEVSEMVSFLREYFWRK